MACNFPMLMYRQKVANANGKIPLTSDRNKGSQDHPSLWIRCGRCIQCRLDKSYDWAMRCELESKNHKQNSFITLTYSNEHLPSGSYNDPTLLPRDLTLFFKRLRKRIMKDHGQYIRYFACGEYGERNRRPHYHACIFGFDFPDKKFDYSKKGYDYFTSDLLAHEWPYGLNNVTGFSFETAAYVARYTLGKVLGRDRHVYEELGIVPEFVRMSRGSKKIGTKGIGYKHYQEFFSDMFPNDVMVTSKGRITKPPKYFMNQLEKDNPELHKLLKEQRSFAPHKSLNWQRCLDRDAIRLFKMKDIARNLDHD
jgi:hypothetical protein